MVFTREALYEAVWTQTIRDLCTAHNMTYGGIVEACDALGVPRPSPGHWGKVARGQTPPRPDLPPAAAGTRTSVELRPRVPRPKVPTPAVTTETEARGPRQQHALVRRSRAALKAGKPDVTRGLQSASWSEPCLDIHVFPANVPRALDILDGLIQRLMQVGASIDVRVAERERPTTWVKVNGESVQLRLDEKVRITRRTPTKEEMARPLYAYFPRDVTEYSSTGILTLSLVNLQGTGARRLWTDNAMGKVEERLDDVVQGLVAGAVALKQHRAAQEQSARMREEAHKRAERDRLEAERDGAILDQMLQMRRHWTAARELQTFVNEVATLFPQDARDRAMQEWFDIAAWAIDMIDPLATPEKARMNLTRPDASKWYAEDFLTGPPNAARVRRYSAFRAQVESEQARAAASGAPPSTGVGESPGSR